jgi:ABC-2 type transport system ATP-binding protein
MDMLIEIDGLRVTLGGARILHDVHLSIAEGEIYGLLGPNGAGKSTTIAAALGLLKPEAGHVRVLGEDPLFAARKCYEHLGVLPEHNGFYDWMSAEDYLGFFAALYDRKVGVNRLSHLLSTVGLEPRPGQTIGTYSQGMRQRLGLARALLSDPKLLILDEPTNGLDPRGRREVHDILIGLAARGVGTLLCTHLLDDVDRLCQRIGIIVAGRTVAEGAITELIGSEGQELRFRLRLSGKPPAPQGENEHVSVIAHEGEWRTVELSPTVTPDAAWRELLFRGWPIAEIRRQGGGLEDLYLSLTERRAA